MVSKSSPLQAPACFRLTCDDGDDEGKRMMSTTETILLMLLAVIMLMTIFEQRYCTDDVGETGWESWLLLPKLLAMEVVIAW